MTARRDLAIAVEGCERQIDAIFAPLAVQMRLSVMNRTAGATVDDRARSAILADLDIYLTRLRGHRRGERAAIFEVIERWADAAALAPIDAEVERMRRILRGESSLLEAVERA